MPGVTVLALDPPEVQPHVSGRAGDFERVATLRVALATGELLDCLPTDIYGISEAALPLGLHTCSQFDAGQHLPLGVVSVTLGDGPLLVVFER